MLRLNVLAVLCLGVLAGCGSSEPVAPAPAEAAQQKLTPVPLAAAFGISTTSLPFLNQKTGTTSPTQTVTVSNIGSSGNVTVTSIDLVPATTEFTVSPSIGSSIPSGGDQDYLVAFKPASNGQKTVSLVFTYKLTSNGSTTTSTVALSGTGVTYAADVLTPSRTFAAQRVGTTSTAQTVTVKNVGSGTLSISAVSIGAGEPFDVTPTAAFTLAAGATKDLSVTFSPTAAGAASGTLSLTTDDVDRPTLTVSLTGTGAKPTISLSAPSLDFMTQRVGTTSAAQTVTVTNTGALPLIVSAVSFGAGEPYAVSPTGGFTVAANGGTKVLSVTFSPTAAGTAPGTLSLSSDDSARPTATVSLTGTGQKPTISLSTLSLDFMTQRVGTTSAAQTVTVTNSGDLPLIVSTVSFGAGEPYAVSPTGGFTVAANGGTKVLSVTFSPTAAGAAPGTLSLSSDDSARPTATVSLTGTGQKPTISLSAPTLSFTAQRVGTTSAAQTVTVTNTGDLPLIVSAVSVGAGEPFAVTPNTGFTVAANGGTKVLSVTFSPTAAGAATGTLSLSSDDPARLTATVGLTGTGAKPTISLSAPSLDFMTQRVGTTSAAQTVTVTNTGALPLIVSAVSFGAGEPYAVSPTGGFTVAANGGTKVLSVTFSPTAAGTAPGTLSLSSDDPARPTATVSLTGTGQKPTISLSTPSLSFTAQRVGTTSAAQTVTVTNTGALPLIVSTVSFGAGEPYAVSPTGGFTVAANGGTKVLSVTFSPTAAGAAPGTLSLSSDDSARPTATVSLTGTGQKPTISLSVPTLSFTAQRVGTTSTAQTVTVTNTGDLPLIVSAVSVGAGEPFAVTPNTGFTVAANGGTKVLSVTFSPTAAGAATGTLSLSSDDPARLTATVGLAGTGQKPTISLSAPTLSFTAQRVGTTSTVQTVTVTNTGALPLIVSAVSVGAGEPFDVTPNTGFTVAANGGTEVLSVTFSPTAAGAASGTLSLSSDDPARPTATVGLMGTGAKPTISLSTPSLSFTAQRVGTTSAAQTVTVTNTGALPLIVSAVSLGAGEPYAVSPTGGFTVAANGGTKVLSVTFSPTAAGATSGTLSLSSDDTARPTATVSLTGTGQKPTISLSTPSLDFMTQRVGTTSAAQTVTVTNSGALPLVVSAVSFGAGEPFAVTPNTGFTVAANGGTRVLSVTFSPTAAGAITGTLSLSSDDSARPTATVSLAGTGQKPTISLNPPSLSFAAQRVGTTSAAQTVTVTNTGDLPLIVSAVSVGAGEPFAVTPTAGFTVAANGGTQVISVTFSPSAAQAATGTLSLASDDPARPSATVSLMGNGVNPTIGVVSSMAFLEQQVNTSAQQTLTVSNTGMGTLTISSITKGGTGAAVYFFTPATLDIPGGQNRTVTVTFAPTDEGPANATLTLNTNDVAHATVNITLSGTGVKPIIAVIPPLAFGDVLVNSSPAPTRQLMISNIGSGTLHISNPIRSGSGAAFYSVSPTSLDVQAGDSKPLTVTFNPTVEGPADAVLTLTTNDVAKPTVNVSLQGYGGRPAVSVDPSALDFQGVRVGTAKTKAITIKNEGRAPLSILGTPTVSPTGAFTYVGPGSFTINPGKTFDVQVSFAPVANINYSATLTIVSNAPSSPTTVALIGSGADPQLTVSPTSIFFGDVRVGDQSAAQEVSLTVTNATGPTEIALTSLPVVGPFVVIPPAGMAPPTTIQSGTNYKFIVKFKPTQPSVDAPAVGSVTIITDLPQRPTIALSGNGTVSKVELSAPSLNFGSQRVKQKSGTQPIILSNKGAAELVIEDLSFSNSAFTLESPAPPTSSSPLTIAAGAQKALNIAFNPPAVGTTAGKLSIISNAFVSAPALDLSGKGVDGQMSLTPSVVSFGLADVTGTGISQSVELRNTGEYPLEVLSVSPPADGQFTVSGLEPHLVLPPAGAWTFTVTFTPARRGYSPSSAVIVSDAVTNKQFSLALSGTGVAAEGELQPTDLTFGSTNVKVPVTKDISIKNIGEKPLSVSNITFEGGSPAPEAALDFSLDTSVALPFAVDPGKSTLVRLKFTPQEPNQRQAKVRFFTNAGPKLANVGGVGTSPTLRLSAPELRFTNVLVGTTSAPQTVTITNNGTGPLTISDIKLAGTDKASFLMTPPQLPVTLLPLASTIVSVSLKTDEERRFSAQLQVLSNDATAPTATVDLSGDGVGQQIQVSETSLEFGNQLLNKPSAMRTVRVTNNGDTTITMSGVSVEGEGSTQFTLNRPTLPLDLKPRDSQSISVIFTPQAQADVTCKLKLAFSTPVPREVSLHGRGIPAVLESNPPSVSLGAVRVNKDHAVGIEIINRSSETITLAKPVLTARNGDTFFKINADSVAQRSLSPGASTIVTLNYNSTAETLSEATLSLDTVPPQPRTLDVPLSAKATQRLLSVTPGSLDFGRVEVGEQMEPKEITVVNKSAKDQWVVVKLKTVEGTHYVLDTTQLDSKTIPPEGSATFKLSFIPEKAGEEPNVVQVSIQGENETEADIPVIGHGRQLTGQGGGCSSTGTTAASAGVVLVVLMALGSRRRRRGETDGV